MKNNCQENWVSAESGIYPNNECYRGCLLMLSRIAEHSKYTQTTRPCAPSRGHASARDSGQHNVLFRFHALRSNAPQSRRAILGGRRGSAVSERQELVPGARGRPLVPAAAQQEGNQGPAAAGGHVSPGAGRQLWRDERGDDRAAAAEIEGRAVEGAGAEVCVFAASEG